MIKKLRLSSTVQAIQLRSASLRETVNGLDGSIFCFNNRHVPRSAAIKPDKLPAFTCWTCLPKFDRKLPIVRRGSQQELKRSFGVRCMYGPSSRSIYRLPTEGISAIVHGNSISPEGVASRAFAFLLA